MKVTCDISLHHGVRTSRQGPVVMRPVMALQSLLPSNGTSHFVCRLSITSSVLVPFFAT